MHKIAECGNTRNCHRSQQVLPSSGEAEIILDKRNSLFAAQNASRDKETQGIHPQHRGASSYLPGLIVKIH
jgi:hypothetical protein